jgi:probable addiction module antidote protein
MLLQPKVWQENTEYKRFKYMNKLTSYDPATALIDDEAIVIFINDALETGDAAYIAKVLGVVARAKGVSQVAAETGLSREQLYRSFSDKGNPTLKSMLAVMKALGFGLTIKSI